MPRAKRSPKSAVPTTTVQEQPVQRGELQGEAVAEVEENSSADRPSYRVFAHDNVTGLRYIEDYERRAVALSFSEKPAEETIAKLRASAFQWSADAQAWLAPANYVNRDAGQKLFREIAGIHLEGQTPF